jgi:RNA polymerase-interacting CarD/CdnL/TRCF family regulator
MLQPGDQVVHRIHGAGTVVAILRPHSAPRECQYYELDLLASDTRLMVPVEGAETILRPVSPPSTVEEALATIQQASSDVAAKGSRRQRSQRRLQASLRTGQVRAVAEVIRRLRARSRRRSLSFTDRRTLRRAIAFLASELALAEAIPFERAKYQVERFAS